MWVVVGGVWWWVCCGDGLIIVVFDFVEFFFECGVLYVVWDDFDWCVVVWW